MVREYYEVWKFIGIELDVDRSVMNTIEEYHSSDCSRLHALIEVWLDSTELTGIKRQDLGKALQSQRVISALASMLCIKYYVMHYVRFYSQTLP